MHEVLDQNIMFEVNKCRKNSYYTLIVFHSEQHLLFCRKKINLEFSSGLFAIGYWWIYLDFDDEKTIHSDAYVLRHWMA